MDKGSEQIFFQRRYTDGQQAHEKMLNISNYQGNTNDDSADEEAVPDDAESAGAGTEAETRTENPRIGSKGT